MVRVRIHCCPSNIRRPEHASVFSERRGLPATGLSRLDAGDRYGPFTWCRPRLEKASSENTGLLQFHDLTYLVFGAMIVATLLFRRTLKRLAGEGGTTTGDSIARGGSKDATRRVLTGTTPSAPILIN
jgi:hypothetical protein